MNFGRLSFFAKVLGKKIKDILANVDLELNIFSAECYSRVRFMISFRKRRISFQAIKH